VHCRRKQNAQNDEGDFAGLSTNTLKKGFPQRLDHLADTIYFGASRDSIGLQMSDHCNFFIKRHLMGRDDSERFYKVLSPFIIPNSVFDPSELSE
jgi:hypothetical protein